MGGGFLDYTAIMPQYCVTEVKAVPTHSDAPMALRKFGRQLFSVRGLCCVLGVGYLYILKQYFCLEYYHYKRKRALLEHDANPSQMNMIMVERYLKEKSQR